MTYSARVSNHGRLTILQNKLLLSFCTQDGEADDLYLLEDISKNLNHVSKSSCSKILQASV